MFWGEVFQVNINSHPLTDLPVQKGILDVKSSSYQARIAVIPPDVSQDVCVCGASIEVHELSHYHVYLIATLNFWHFAGTKGC